MTRDALRLPLKYPGLATGCHHPSDLPAFLQDLLCYRTPGDNRVLRPLEPEASADPLNVIKGAPAVVSSPGARAVRRRRRTAQNPVVRGVPPEWLRTASVRAEVIRPPEEDLFR